MAVAMTEVESAFEDVDARLAAGDRQTVGPRPGGNPHPVEFADHRGDAVAFLHPHLLDPAHHGAALGKVLPDPAFEPVFDCCCNCFGHGYPLG